jgi:sulfatase maturation enzyme AslB (radical SAM superfamily)
METGEKARRTKGGNLPAKNGVAEWNGDKRWNPFNSYKLLSHVERWSLIKRGRPIPAPALITVDPTNICNFNCAWCNAGYIRTHRKYSLSQNALRNLANFLPRWGRKNFDRYGVEAICIAGGGEPLLNPHTPDFIDHVVANGIEVGMVTNGSFLSDYMDALSQCTWIGVSVDAGSAATFDKLKGLSPGKASFDLVIKNIALLVEYANTHHTRLGLPHPSYGLSYKYLLYKDNIGEIYTAARLAKEIGCKHIHFRPAGTAWDKLGTAQETHFTPEDIALFQEQIRKTMELDDDSFSVYGITHKFSGQFDRDNQFNRCHSLFMTAVIQPPSKKEAPQDSFNLGLCCDRRGDSRLELLTDEEDVAVIDRVWGSKQHWSFFDGVDVALQCPRCTYQPHNQIYENVILRDSMTYKFI